MSGARSGTNWPAAAAVFALVIGFTYSDDLVEFVVDFSDGTLVRWRWLVMVLDLTLVAAAAVIRWYLTSPPREFRAFLDSLLSGWWALGSTMVIVIHLVLLFTVGPSNRWPVANSAWLTLLTTAAFVAAMGMLLVAALGSGRGSRGWIAPVLIGTFIVQLASALWYPVIDRELHCANDISPEYFNGMVQVLPVFLVTLGLEVNYLRNSKAIREPGRREVASLTVMLLCGAEALAFSMLVKADTPHCGRAAVWHEYIAFVATVHAAAISLATLAWLLLADPRSRCEPDVSVGADL